MADAAAAGVRAEGAAARRRELAEHGQKLQTLQEAADLLRRDVDRNTRAVDRLVHSARWVVESAAALEEAYRNAEDARAWSALRDTAMPALVRDVAAALGLPVPDRPGVEAAPAAQAEGGGGGEAAPVEPAGMAVDGVGGAGAPPAPPEVAEAFRQWAEDLARVGRRGLRVDPNRWVWGPEGRTRVPGHFLVSFPVSFRAWRVESLVTETLEAALVAANRVRMYRDRTRAERAAKWQRREEDKGKGKGKGAGAAAKGAKGAGAGGKGAKGKEPGKKGKDAKGLGGKIGKGGKGKPLRADE
jgi:hypothetical protein